MARYQAYCSVTSDKADDTSNAGKKVVWLPFWTPNITGSDGV
ncbi:Uncharacterised protein [Vibrio cholerae]|nr:Uncharacterised protein [Vibrio cholerae]CSI60012.1 Uncharacterised protein [Vibrio cholerae]